MATLAARIAGWVLGVSLRSSSGPSKQRVLRGNPSVRSASTKASRAQENASWISLPMPAY